MYMHSFHGKEATIMRVATLTFGPRLRTPMLPRDFDIGDFKQKNKALFYSGFRDTLMRTSLNRKALP